MENVEKQIEELEGILQTKLNVDLQEHLDVTKLERYNKTDLTKLPKLTTRDIRKILGDRRFDMSGYDSFVTGSCTVHNQMVLNVFAKYGIYDYTEYLFLDFYKGTVTLYYRYWREEEHMVNQDWGGMTTSKIILEILNLTVYSGKQTRRRS